MFFASFWIVSLTPYNNKHESLRDLTVFITSSNSLFDIIIVVFSEPKMILCIPGSAADVAAFNPNEIKIFQEQF